MRGIYALYSSPESAQRAVDGLRAAGIPDRSITILASEPLEEYEFARRDRATWMPWIAGMGAAGGLACGYYLASVTQNLWPIDTGGMPIVSNWTNLIVIFELTMLGGILATVITLFITAKIPAGEPKLYDPDVADGKILVGVENPRDTAVPAIEQALLSGGVAELKRR